MTLLGHSVFLSLCSTHGDEPRAEMTRPDYCYRLAMTIRVDKRTYDGPLLGYNGDPARKRFTLDVQQRQIIAYPSPRPRAGREQ
jgi:hypothetical protein